MNTKTDDFRNCTISTLVIGTCLLLAMTADAGAHDVEYRPYVVTRHYMHNQPLTLPRWLRANREFQHWYAGSRYRLRPDLGWQRIYDVYCFEKRYQSQGRRYYGRVVHDRTSRANRKKSKKRRH